MPFILQAGNSLLFRRFANVVLEIPKKRCTSLDLRNRFFGLNSLSLCDKMWWMVSTISSFKLMRSCLLANSKEALWSEPGNAGWWVLVMGWFCSIWSGFWLNNCFEANEGHEMGWMVGEKHWNIGWITEYQFDTPWYFTPFNNIVEWLENLTIW